MIIFLLIGLFFGGLVVTFAFQNVTTITVSFLTWDITGSLAVILLIAVASGALISLLISLPNTIRDNFKISKLQHQNNILKEKLADKDAKMKSEKKQT
jgi:uncharacterized integral membrane protein